LQRPVRLELGSAGQLFVEHAVRVGNDGGGDLLAVADANGHHATGFRTEIDSESKLFFGHSNSRQGIANSVRPGADVPFCRAEGGASDLLGQPVSGFWRAPASGAGRGTLM